MAKNMFGLSMDVTMWIHCDQLLALNNSLTGSTPGSTDANAGATSADSYVSIDQNDHHDGGNSLCVLTAVARGSLMPIVQV